MVSTPLVIEGMTPIQLRYYYDEHRFAVCSAGRRGRKTLIGARKVLRRAGRKRGRYFFGAPTEGQAKSIFWDSPTSGLLRNVVPAMMDGQPNRSELSITLRNGSFLQVVGMDRPARVEGRPWDGCILSEVPNMRQDFWAAHVRPALSDTLGFAILDGVPEGRNFYYNDFALYACGGVIPQTVPLQGAYATNPDDPDWAFFTWFSSDVLDPGEVAAAKRGMDERTFRQEYEGSFEGLGGLAYYAFGPENLRLVERVDGATVHVGMDFNVNPMTAVLCHVEGDTVSQFGEIWLPNSNTYEMVQALKDRFPVKQCIIYPDSTGRARESNATASDIAILEQAGFKVYANSVNPRERDRVNAVNGRIRSMDGVRRYVVNPKTCPKTVNDLGKVECLPDGRLNKEQERSGLKHISDALGYFMAYLFPVAGGGIYIPK